MAELKPCPFCGGTDILIDTYLNGTMIWCTSCNATISKMSYLEYHNVPDVKENVEPKVIEMWNRRVGDG